MMWSSIKYAIYYSEGGDNSITHGMHRNDIIDVIGLCSGPILITDHQSELHMYVLLTCNDAREIVINRIK